MMVPPPTPNRPLKAPAAVAITASRRSLGDIAGILRRVSAPTADKLAESLPRSPPTPPAQRSSATSTARWRPIVKRPEEAHVREEISLLLGTARAALRAGGLRVRAARGRGAPAGRRGRDRLRGLPRRRGAVPGREAPDADGGLRQLAGPRAPVRARARELARPQAAAHPGRGQGPDQRLPLARRARRGRRRDLARGRGPGGRDRGLRHPLGPQGAGDPPARARSTRARACAPWSSTRRSVPPCTAATT